VLWVQWLIFFGRGIVLNRQLEYDMGGALIDIGAKAPGFLPSRVSDVWLVNKLLDQVFFQVDKLVRPIGDG